MARLWSNRSPALIVIRLPIVTASLANAAAVTNRPPALEGPLEIDCERRAAAVFVPHAGRNEPERAVLAPFDVPAYLRRVIGAPAVHAW